MKTNVNLFIALVLCAVMGGLLYFLVRPAQDDLGWNPNEMYGELGARSYDGSSFTNATLSGASNGGVALSMPHTSFSIRTRVSPTTYSPLPISNSPSPIANGPSPIAYMTSGAEYRSFGGGGNGNIGSAGTFRASAQSPISNSQSPMVYTPSPIAYSPSPISYSQLPISNSPSPISNTPATVASGSNPAGLFSYALQTSYGTASYETSTFANLSQRNNVSGRKNLSDGFGNTWLNWLDDHFGGSKNLNWWDAWNAYNAMISTWNESKMGIPPTWEQFLEWLEEGGEDGYTKGHNTYIYVPIGNILPLLLMAILYAIILFVKRNKTAQL